MKYDDGIVIHTNLPLRKINDFGDSADVVVDCFQRTVNLKLINGFSKGRPDSDDLGRKILIR